jgi:nucleotide-binding universal stress UspA family protein
VPNLAIRAGNAGHLIGEAAARSKADLVVLGPHSKRPLRDVLEGTIAAKTLVSTVAPVLVVRAAAERAYGRVLLALDISEASASAIRAAETFVLTDRADATVVHAHTPPYEGMLYSTRIGMEAMAGYAENWSREATRSVRTLLKRESDDVSRYDIHIEHGPAAPAITKTVERFAPDLLVLGTGGVGRLRRALIGSVANRVLHESTCDVLIVPTGWSAAMSLNPASYRARTS